MNILLSTYACEPGKGSEAGVGWNWVCQAARFHDVWTITREKNRAAIESSLEPLPRVHWVASGEKSQRGIIITSSGRLAPILLPESCIDASRLT
jgi:hypothetical protein